MNSSYRQADDLAVQSGRTVIRNATRGRLPYLLWPIWLVWLPLLLPPVVDLFRTESISLHLVAIILCVGLFVSLYVWGSWQNLYELDNALMPLSYTPKYKWLLAGTLIGLSLIVVVLSHANSQWLELFIFSSAYVNGSFRPRYGLPLVGLIIALSLIVGRLIGLNTFDVLQNDAILVVTGITTISLVRAFVASRELTMAREEIARLAVMNERLRIARDLHDLLGHNLSLIALKSELARRLIAVSPERAAIEIGDVETVARTTLQEVREAVGLYRQPTLPSELHGAQEMLTAAGIAYQYEGTLSAIDDLPATIEGALGWTIREGVTNVIRHSRAQHCLIQLMRDPQMVAVEIVNDSAPLLDRETGTWQGIAGIKISNGGHGLHGLTERITALGGRCESGARADGGFRLAVSVPLSPLSHKLRSSQDSTASDNL